MHGVPVVLYSLLSLAAPAAPPQQHFSPWEVGEGVFARDPRMPALIEAASQAREQALLRLDKEWGPAPGATPIRWIWDTAAVEPGARAANAEPLQEFELGRTYFDHGTVVVSVPARKFLSRPRSVRGVIQHELFHAVHGSHAGSRERYEAAPRWFREGAALLFSGEGAERVRERVAYTVFEGADAISFLKGVSLQPGSSETVSHAEAYLAVRWLRQELGHGNYSVLVRKVIGGENLARMVRELLGLGTSSASMEMRRAARMRIRQLLPPSRQKRCQLLFAKLEDGAANVTWELEVLLAEDESRPLASTLRYLLAKEALRRAGNPRYVAAARGHLEALRSAPGTLWRPEALVLLGQCYLREGRRAAARRSWLEVIEVFGEDRAASSQARRLLAATEK